MFALKIICQTNNRMNPNKLSIVIPILLILLSCNNQPAKTTKAKLTDSIPEGTVPFEFDFKMNRMILIPGTLNDSIRLKYLFETGSLMMRFSDILASDFERIELENGFGKVQKTMKVRIGGWERTYGDTVEARYFDKNNHIIGYLGANVAMIPWQFFDQKIIEISFSKQYIRELPGTRDLPGYDSVKMEMKNGFLGIPVAVSVQGKKIREFVTIDTGTNGTISFNNSVVSKYGIKSDSAFFEKALRTDGFQKSFAIKSDTIQVGKFSLTRKRFVSFALKKQTENPFSGLLGTGI